jgi:hypothetical protein
MMLDRDGQDARRSATAAVLAVATALLVLPALASAQSPFQRYSTAAPGGGAFAVVGGNPYVARTSSAGVRVYRFTAAGSWKQVGAAVRRDAGRRIGDLSLAAGPDGAPWLIWSEEKGNKFLMRAARFTGVSWQQVGGPVNPATGGQFGIPRAIASQPQLVFFEGRPYVAMLTAGADTSATVMRLTTNGRAWRRVGGVPQGARTDRVRIAVARGRLYSVVREVFFPTMAVGRLNAAGTGWERLPSPQTADAEFADVAGIDGRVEILFGSIPGDGSTGSLDVSRLGADDVWRPAGDPVATGISGRRYNGQSLIGGDGPVRYATWIPEEGPDAGTLRVSRFVNGTWTQLPSPTGAGFAAGSARLLPGAGGGTWMLSGESQGSGAPLWRLDGTGVSVPADPAPGPCGTVVRGTPLADLLAGTRRADDIFGFAAGDRLVGLAGNDCIHGGPGRDGLVGGRGSDALTGGDGNDVVDGGPGADDLNGNAGADRIVGGPGGDAIAAGSGNDTILIAGGGSDVVDCGPGFDTVRLSPEDGTKNCEREFGR